ncbi:MAG: DUF2380 domain-containing protein, partial [Acidobacteria bacterium]|nr:DUF2380 domain-containing protein [Acidobacteriota bacterium]
WFVADLKTRIGGFRLNPEDFIGGERHLSLGLHRGYEVGRVGLPEDEPTDPWGLIDPAKLADKVDAYLDAKFEKKPGGSGGMKILVSPVTGLLRTGDSTGRFVARISAFFKESDPSRKLGLVTGKENVIAGVSEFAGTVGDVVAVEQAVSLVKEPALMALQAAQKRAAAALAKDSAGLALGERMPKSAALPSGVCFSAGTLVLAPGGYVPIEVLRVGDRVLTTDGAGENDQSFVEEAAWERLSLRMPNPDGSRDVLEIELLRSSDWVARVGAQEGRWISFELPEMGLAGPAHVVSRDRCPPIQPGLGRLILATVTHLNGHLLRLRLEGLTAPVEPTETHRFFSITRDSWVAAGNLNVGEILRTLTGATRIRGIESMPGIYRVFNIEVQTKHDYFVTPLNVLSHNENPCARQLIAYGEGPEADAMRVVGARDAGLSAPPKHHIFPQEFEVFFEQRGFVGNNSIHQFTVELEPAVHQAIHGGGNWRLGRTWPGEWNTRIMAEITSIEKMAGRRLTFEEVFSIGEDLMSKYGIDGPFVAYK